MRKTAIILLSIFFLSNVLISSQDYKSSISQLFVFDKRVENDEAGKSVFVVILVPYSDEHDYKDFVKYPRMRYVVSREIYDRVVFRASYYPEELRVTGIALQAERQEGEVLENTAQLREQMEKTELIVYDKQMKEACEELIAEAEDFKSFIRTLVEDNEIIGSDLTELQEKADNFKRKKNEVTGKLPYYIAKGYDLEFEFIDKASELNDIYFRGFRHSDNRNHDIQNFFQEHTGI